MDRLADWTIILIMLSCMAVIWGSFGYLVYSLVSLVVGFLTR